MAVAQDDAIRHAVLTARSDVFRDSFLEFRSFGSQPVAIDSFINLFFISQGEVS